MGDRSGGRIPGSRRFLRHPTQVVVAGFAGAIAVGTALLMLPAARSGPGGATLLEALFTATSSVCVTGLIVVDTPTYFSPLGQVIILMLIQVGGFGIMTFASLLGLLVARRLGLRTRLTAATESRSLGVGDIKRVLFGVVLVTVVVECATAVVLGARFLLAYDESFGRALYLGVFHSISAFNNAGFALYTDNLVGFVGDLWICVPVAVAVILGGIGFPVIFELRRHLRHPRGWSMHSKLTLITTGLLLVFGTLFVVVAEWGNPRTLGTLDGPTRILAGFFQSVILRTAGFNTIDISQLNQGTLLGMDVLMFIGGGSGGTAGGIKVTTFALLFFVIAAEVRGERTVTLFERRLDPRALRQALTVALLAVGIVVGATIVMVELTRLPTDQVLFESVSAFATVGLSTGITATLPPAGQLILITLMFVGRLGPITMVSALAVRQGHRKFEYPEGRPLIG